MPAHWPEPAVFPPTFRNWRSPSYRARASPAKRSSARTMIPSLAQPSGQSREIERAEAVMRQPSRVGFEELPQVRHAVFQHGDAVDPQAPGKTLVLTGVDSAIA